VQKGQVYYDLTTDQVRLASSATDPALSIASNGNVIVNSGNVGIGTTSPGAKLDVYGSTRIALSASYDALQLSSVSTPGNGVNFESLNVARTGYTPFTFYGTSYSFTNAGTPLVTFQSNGNVGIGTTSPTKKFEVNGTSGAFNVDPTYSGGPLLNTTANNLTITSATGNVIIQLG